MKKYIYLLSILFINILVIGNVYAEANGGYPGAGTGAGYDGGSGYGGCNGGVVLGHGYRISLVYDDGKNNKYPTSGYRISGTYSIDYWAINDYDYSDGKTCGLTELQNGGYRVYTKNIRYTDKCTKQEVVYNGKCGTLRSGALPSTNNYRDIFNDYTKSKDKKYTRWDAWFACGNKTCYKGNYITYWAMEGLKAIFTKEDTKILEDDYNKVNTILVNSGYKKSNEAKANVSAAAGEGVIIQIEPVVAYYKSCDYAYVGSLAEWQNDSRFPAFSNGQVSDTAYGTPTVYSPQNDKDLESNPKITRKAGISLKVNSVSSSDMETLDSSLGVAMFRVSDLKDECGDDLKELLDGVDSKETEKSYKKKVDALAAKYPDLCAGKKCHFLNYSLSEIRFLGYGKGKKNNVKENEENYK